MSEKKKETERFSEDRPDTRPEVLELFENIKAKAGELEKLLAELNDHWSYEDRIYRFYHQSFKVYFLQGPIKKMVEVFTELAPKKNRPKSVFKKEEVPLLNEWFMKIIAEGTAKEFDLSDNKRWLEATRPIVEAFFHAHFFLEMIVKYLKEFKDEKAPPAWLPSGWAAILYLFNMR
jgi:hypothetical protein